MGSLAGLDLGQHEHGRDDRGVTSLGVFPNPQSRCCGWRVRFWSKPTTNGRPGDRRYLAEGTMALLADAEAPPQPQ